MKKIEKVNKKELPHGDLRRWIEAYLEILANHNDVLVEHVLELEKEVRHLKDNLKGGR